MAPHEIHYLFTCTETSVLASPYASDVVRTIYVFSSTFWDSLRRRQAIFFYCLWSIEILTECKGGSVFINITKQFILPAGEMYWIPTFYSFI